MPVREGVVVPIVRVSFLMMGAFAGLSCRNAPPASAPVAIALPEVQLHHFGGEPLGPTTRIADDVVAQALSLEVQILAVDAPPAGLGEPLAVTARLIASTSGTEPVLPAARLAREGRLVSGSDPKEFAAKVPGARLIAERRGALPLGATATISTDDSLPLDGSASGGHRQLNVQISRPAKKPDKALVPLQIVVSIQDLYQPPRPLESPDDTALGSKGPAEPVLVPAPAAVLTREMLVFEPPLHADKGCVAILLPMQFSGTGHPWVAAVITLSPGAKDASFSLAMDALREDLKAAGEGSTTQPAVSGDASAVDVAIASLSRADRRRSALVFLAGQADAAWCEDAALIADDTVLAHLADVIRERYLNSVPSPRGQELGWLLDRATFQILGDLLATGKLPPELSAVFVTHAGEAGRNPASVEEVSKGLAARTDFENRLLAENMIFLEDTSPSARVRAFDWLASHGLAPSGYNPLGTPRDRRAALDRATNAPSASTAGVTP